MHKYNKNKINPLDLHWYFNKTTDLEAEINVYIHHTLVEIGAKNCHPKPITNLVWKTSLISLHEAEGNNRAKRIKLAHNRPAADHQTAQAQTTAHVLWVLQAAVNGALCERAVNMWTPVPNLDLRGPGNYRDVFTNLGPAAGEMWQIPGISNT